MCSYEREYGLTNVQCWTWEGSGATTVFIALIALERISVLSIYCHMLNSASTEMSVSQLEMPTSNVSLFHVSLCLESSPVPRQMTKWPVSL
ncbi:hypothetical protein BDZ94DRAFT_1270924, partial [Collybia nuda]